MAAAWCEHIGVTKGALGTGLLEEATGLPISGGSLRCDYAKAPDIFGMQLVDSAVEFYETNCIGCTERKATDAAEHLGTWAEAVIAQRSEREAEAEAARRRAEEERRKRREARRLLHGRPDPTLQSILDLADRVDAEQRDTEAEQLLASHAEMAPGDFPDALVDHLAAEALAIGNSAFFTAVVAIFERQGRPTAEQMLGLAFGAIERGVATPAAGRVVATHAKEFPSDSSVLAGLVMLAAGERGWPSRRRTGMEPAALLRFFDCDPAGSVGLVSSMLKGADEWTRSDAAHAAETLAAARPDAAPLLLPALLDSLTYSDSSRYAGDPFTAVQAARVIAQGLASSPVVTDQELGARLNQADAGQAKRLWRCYDRACDLLSDGELQKPAIDTIAERAIGMLAEDHELELLGEVADTLERVSRYHDESDDLLSKISRLVFLWAERQHDLASREPTGSQATLEALWEWPLEYSLTAAVLRHLKASLASAAKHAPQAYVETLQEQWSAADSVLTRAPLLDVLGEVVTDQDLVVLATPLLAQSIESENPVERASALNAIGRFRFDHMALPADLTVRVLDAFKDRVLGVFLGAIRATHRLDVPASARPNLIETLLDFARAYGPMRIHSEDVRSALGLALRLANGHPYQEAVVGVVLDTIGTVPSAEGVELLERLGLEDHDKWLPTAVRTLHLDPDPNYYGIGDWQRLQLLRKLAAQPSNKLAPFFGELVDVARERLHQDHAWAWAVADVLALHHEYEMAAALSEDVVATLRDTPEQRPARSFARQIAVRHRLNAALVSEDEYAVDRATAEWDEVAGDGQGGQE